MKPIGGKRHWIWACRNYNMTAGVDFMLRAGWWVRAAVLVIGPIGFCVVWRRRDEVAKAEMDHDPPGAE